MSSISTSTLGQPITLKKQIIFQMSQAGCHCPEIRSEHDVLFAPQLTHSRKKCETSHSNNTVIRVYLHVHCDFLREIRKCGSRFFVHITAENNSAL